jgi:hypothetical protein
MKPARVIACKLDDVTRRKPQVIVGHGFEMVGCRKCAHAVLRELVGIVGGKLAVAVLSKFLVGVCRKFPVAVSPKLEAAFRL